MVELKSASDQPSAVSPPPPLPGRRALVVRIGALGDLLLTRRLTYSLWRAGFHSTLLAPARHAGLLLADRWIETVFDSESPAWSGAFAGSWPADSGGFDLAVLISNSGDLARAVRRSSPRMIQVPPQAKNHAGLVARQWAEAAREHCAPFTEALPLLEPEADGVILPGATLIHPGSGSPGKNWPLERFAAMARRLSSLGHRVTWIRGPAEAGLPSEAWPGPVIDRPSLPALAATLAESRLFIGNDSGVSHLAAAVGAPCVVLFGPTDPSLWAPDGSRVRVLRSRDGDLAAISVGEAVEAVEDMARLNPSRRGQRPKAGPVQP
jgi:ADP-heptose:LPS heptosyltransferase